MNGVVCIDPFRQNLVSGIGQHAFELEKALVYFVQKQGRFVAILYFGTMHDQADGQPRRIDQGVDLAALHPLDRVATHGVGWIEGRFERTALTLADTPRRDHPEIRAMCKLRLEGQAVRLCSATGG